MDFVPVILKRRPDFEQITWERKTKYKNVKTINVELIPALICWFETKDVENRMALIWVVYSQKKKKKNRNPVWF